LKKIDLRDLAILADLSNGKHVSKITGLILKGFNLDRDPNTIYRRLLLLESMGYVGRGFPISQADTYFITEEGIKFYQEAIS